MFVTFKSNVHETIIRLIKFVKLLIVFTENVRRFLQVEDPNYDKTKRKSRKIKLPFEGAKVES